MSSIRLSRQHIPHYEFPKEKEANYFTAHNDNNIAIRTDQVG